MNAELVIRILTISSLAGLLLAVGLRLTFAEVLESVRRSRFLAILAVNFVLVPVLCAVAAGLAGLKQETTTAMVLLGAAPFAPVVPVFARMAKADLALAAGLTSIYPVLSAFLTPWICGLVLRFSIGAKNLQFSSGQVMLVLVATITIPLCVGIALNHILPRLSRLFLRPVEIISEAAGACSLSFVTFVEFRSILGMSPRSLIVTALIFEVCLLAGYWLGREKHSRRVVALGTSNRNIALALLMALQGFSDLQVVPNVVAIGLVLIGLGLAHVGYWVLRDRQLSNPANQP